MTRDQDAKDNVNVARLSVISNTILTSGKFICGFMMGSTAVISEGVHSGIDLMAAVIAFFSVRQSGKPADKQHPFGHGRFENISGFVEGVLIFLAALLIIIEAIEKLFSMSEVRELGWGMAIMGVSVVANTIVSTMLFRVAKKTDSVAIEADGEHLRTDVITSVGVLLGLGAIQLTGWHLLDPLLALVVAGLILNAAYRITKKSFEGLIDTTLGASEERKIRDAVESETQKRVWLRSLRTRKAGADRFIDLVLVACHELDIETAHEVCDRIEISINGRIKNANVHIHVEPCPDLECDHVFEDCILKEVGSGKAR